MAAAMIGTGRAVEVLHDRGPAAPAGADRWTAGSGYLIGGRLVLTAAHAVDYRQDLVQGGQLLVRTIAGRELAASVVLVCDEPSRVDLALLEITVTCGSMRICGRSASRGSIGTVRRQCRTAGR